MNNSSLHTSSKPSKQFVVHPIQTCPLRHPTIATSNDGNKHQQCTTGNGARHVNSEENLHKYIHTVRYIDAQKNKAYDYTSDC